MKPKKTRNVEAKIPTQNNTAIKSILMDFVHWYNNDKDCHCELYNEDIEVFLAQYKSK